MSVLGSQISIIFCLLKICDMHIDIRFSVVKLYKIVNRGTYFKQTVIIVKSVNLRG